MASLFGRLTRYPPRITFNPTENQHTEALAAVLETDVGLSRALAADWLEIAPEDVGSAPRVRTQVPAQGLDRVDLELRFGPAGYPQRIVWVEVKVDAPLSGDDQLRRYWDALLDQPARAHALVLLQRSGEEQPPQALLPREWHREARTALVLTDWARVAMRLTAWPAEPFAQRLVSELVAYLAEGGLVMTEPLQAHHLVALAHVDQAKTVLDWVMREATSSLRIQRGDGHGGDPDWEHFGWRSAPDYWVCFELPVGARVDRGWLEISLAPWTHLDGEIRFGAGLVIEEPNRASKADATVMVKADFDHVHQYHERFYRFKHPGELLAAQTPDAQVELLRDWVQETFGAVERALRNRPLAAPSA